MRYEFNINVQSKMLMRLWFQAYNIIYVICEHKCFIQAPLLKDPCASVMNKHMEGPRCLLKPFSSLHGGLGSVHEFNGCS